MSHPGSRFWWILGLVLLLGGTGAAWYHTNQPHYLLQKGQQALRADRWDEAQLLAARLEADGATDHAHLLRGEAYLRQQRIPQAVEELNQIRESNEEIRQEAAVVFGLGFLSLKILPAETEKLLRYVLKNNPDHLDAHRGLASLYFDQGAKGLALQHVQEWIRLAPRDGHPHRFMAIIYSDFGDSNAWAIEAFREALRLELSPSVVDSVKEELADLLLKQTDYTQALEVLAELPPDRFDSQHCLEIRGECLWGLGRLNELRPLLQQGLQDYPSSTVLLCLHGQVLTAADDPQAAVVPLEQAVRLDPYDTTGRYLLAQTYETLGRREAAAEQRRLLQQARDVFSEISKLGEQAIFEPWDGAVRLRLASLCESVGKHEEAASWRRAAAACPPAAVSTAASPKSLPSTGTLR